MYTRDYPVHDRVLATLRLALDEKRLAAVREAGQALSIEVAVAEAEAVAEAVMLLRGRVSTASARAGTPL
jgi:hypothetical protein